MGFQKIDSVYLEYGKEYKIDDLYRGIYKGKHWRYNTPYFNWDDFEFDYDIEDYLEFDVRRLDNPLISMKMTFSHDVPFYEFFSEKEAIQACMEYRAVNLIIRKVIGDDTFSW
jgi:hypothetical protein